MPWAGQKEKIYMYTPRILEYAYIQGTIEIFVHLKYLYIPEMLEIHEAKQHAPMGDHHFFWCMLFETGL